ncbi:hypothetical protein, partial [Acetobacterium bakii]|uniref:hypothetical protein n=1 Tax=Acetobacterium bakii TaxID=52689 RepID=UPI001A9A5315
RAGEQSTDCTPCSVEIREGNEPITSLLVVGDCPRPRRNSHSDFFEVVSCKLAAKLTQVSQIHEFLNI